MAYLLGKTQLRVVAETVHRSRNKRLLSNVRLLLLQHVLPTTREFIKHLCDAGAEIHLLIGKPYSVDKKVEEELRADGVRLVVKPYSDLETTAYLAEILNEAVNVCNQRKKRLAILEVGGYFAAPLSRLDASSSAYTQVLVGVVEDTTFGHNRYLEQAESIPFPIFSVARSPLKEIEGRFVGKDAVAAAAHVLRSLGITIAGRNALVLGYGMIGSSVARALRTYDLNVSVYDVEDYKNLCAFVDGYRVHKKVKLLESADIIFSATAKTALQLNEIKDHCRDNVILASVGSKDTEFDIAAIKEEAGEQKEEICQDFVRYKLLNDHYVNVLRDGTAINFLLPSLPVEVLDLVFAEMLQYLLELLESPPMRGRVYPRGAERRPGTWAHLNPISKKWASYVNQ